jgi:tetratricopeptide (TPR) repeat protein
MVEIPDSLVERLKGRQAVLVTGFGCGELAGAPGWSALADSLASRLVFSDARDAVTRLTAAGRLADAVAFLRDQLPPTVVEEVIQQAFPPDGNSGTIPEGVRMAVEFPWRVIVTTAFDDLWQRALISAGEAKHLPDPSPPILVADDDPAQVPASGPPAPLLHLFGRVAQPSSLCLGAGDARTRVVPSPALTWLDHVRRRRSLVLVGFRPGDPDLAWFSSWLASRPSHGVPHFLFLDVSGQEDPDTLVSVWALRTGLEVIPCTEGTAEGLGRLARIATSIGARLPPSEAQVDIDAWLNRWEQNPGDPEPRAMLARVEAALRDEERWDRLVELLLRRLDLQDDKDEQLAALSEVAQIFRELLNAPERALTAEVAMLRLAPTDDALWAKLRADARAAGACEQLVTGAIDVATQLGATPDAARIWREIALLQIEDLENVDDALAAYREALAADPGRRDILDEQVEILRHLERWDELVSVLRAASGEADDPERAVALMHEAAELLESRLANVDGAIAAHQAILAMAPESDSAALALERLYEKEKRWADLADVLDKRARRSPPSVSSALRRRRAEILADDLDALDLAAEELESLLAEDPDLKNRVREDELSSSELFAGGAGPSQGPAYDRSLLTLLEQI